MSIDFQTAVPNELITQQPVSTAKTILRKQQLEFYPQDQNTFSSEGNTQMVFKIGSNSDFINLKKSYFEFELSTTVPGQQLASGGVHSLFRTASVRMLSTGNLIQKIDNYNKYAPLYFKKRAPELSTMNMDSSADYAQGDAEGRAVSLSGPHRVFDKFANTFGDISATDIGAGVTLNGVVYPSAMSVQDDDAGSFSFNYVDIGVFSTVGISNGFFTCLGRDDNGDLLLSPSAVAGIHVDLISPLRIYDYAAGSSQVSRSRAQELPTHMIFKPILSIFDLDIPLFLLKGGGLEFRFEIEDAVRALVSHNKFVPSFTISNPRFVGMMITPHQDIVREFMQQWASPEGLLYAIPGVVTRKSTSDNGELGQSLQVHPGVRSARRVWTVQQDSLLHNATGTTAAAASNHTGISLR